MSYTPPPVITVDHDAPSISILLSGREIARTEQVTEGLFVHYDDYDRVVCVEVLT